jgi:hypothetical protein
MSKRSSVFRRDDNGQGLLVVRQMRNGGFNALEFTLWRVSEAR